VVVCGEDEVLSIVRDITAYKRAEEERQRLQEQLFQAQKLEAIGRMASGIAHDFNNILTVMLGMSSLVKNDLPPGNPAHSNIEEVLKAGRRAKELVRQLLTLSRPSQQERRPVQMQQVLTETLGFLRVSLPATIEVRLQIENTPATVLADPTQLQQVILNLCLNAKQAMEEQGGILTIGLASSRETSHPSQFLHPVRLGPHVKLTISDTGHGMTPEIAQRIFEPFFTTKPVEQGSGLGLAIVHAIVTSLGGAIEVNSQPGQGATFDIYLPLVEYVPASSVSISTL
jgi:signal transduction histidine kinase